ncbi:MAG: hypothetical protein ACI9XZ_004166 [Alphaproteobacteria bacterium]|jgi:hypothetical protein
MPGYHDVGGKPAGPIPMQELPWMHWEKQTEALRSLLGCPTSTPVNKFENIF